MNNKKIRVLWFSNCSIADTQCLGSGSWLHGMRDIISPHVELFNLTEANVIDTVYKESSKVKEYIIPIQSLSKEGLPKVGTIYKIKGIVEAIAPDIIHIWGLESYWAKLFAYGYIKGNVLLEIQGVLSACANVFWGGLTPEEIKKTHRLKEWLKPSVRLEIQYSHYVKKAEDEIKLLSKFKNISTQSDWTRLQIKPFLCENTKIFSTLRPIREEFYSAQKWHPSKKGSPVLFTSIGYNVPFKGMHVLLKAFRLVVDKYPDAQLVIAGFKNEVPFYKEDGYNRLLRDYIVRNNLTSNIQFPGKLNASQIIEQLLASDIYVNPTFVESYSAATAEALFLGVPSVLSYAGALPYFNDYNSPVALYYSPLDYIDCAVKILNLYDNKESSSMLSEKAISQLGDKIRPEQIKDVQMTIYQSVLDI